MGFAKNFLNLKVKKVRINWADHYCGVSASAGTTNSNNILVGAHQTTISSHYDYLADNLHSLTKDAQDIGDYIPNNICIEFLTHGSAKSRKGVGSSEDCAPLAFDCSSVFFG